MEHSVVFIILGLLTVAVGMAPIFGLLEGFGDSVPGDDQDAFFSELASSIEGQCDNIERYDSIVDTSVTGELRTSEIVYDDPEIILEEDDDEVMSQELGCEGISIDFRGEASGDSIGEGNWEVIISADSSNDEVGVEVNS